MRRAVMSAREKRLEVRMVRSTIPAIRTALVVAVLLFVVVGIGVRLLIATQSHHAGQLYVLGFYGHRPGHGLFSVAPASAALWFGLIGLGFAAVTLAASGASRPSRPSP